MLKFERITEDSLDTIYQYFKEQPYRTCDFTIGGLYMWIDYFNYEYCIYKDTLFIKGYTEDNLSEKAFAAPIGKLPVKDAISVLQEYCDSENISLVLSAVPEAYMTELDGLFDCQVSKLEDWSDYLYDSLSLATLPGRKYNKKRNHVNKFKRLYENYQFNEITLDNIDRVKQFFDQFCLDNSKEYSLGEYENEMVSKVLENYAVLNFTGGFLEVEGEIIGFTIGEVIGDTLFAHIEKALRTYDGSYEMINTLFVQHILEQNDNILYVNREEDVGDPGLRKAKLSYNPIKLLSKYNVVIK